jgi:hypothetical protein
MSSLGWECPVCHCGNAPTASFCWNCVQQRTSAAPDFLDDVGSHYRDLMWERSRESTKGESK